MSVLDIALWFGLPLGTFAISVTWRRAKKRRLDRQRNLPLTDESPRRRKARS